MEEEIAKKYIIDTIKQVYAVLEFSPREVDMALDDFCGINQSVIAAQMATDFTPGEVDELNKCRSLLPIIKKNSAKL